MIANDVAAIAHTPAARPSTPSEKLTTLMISTMPSMVSGTASGPKSIGPTKGSVTSSTTTPSSTGTATAATCPTSLIDGCRSKTSSSAPTTVISAAPPRIAGYGLSSRSHSAAATATPAKMARPPRTGVMRSEQAAVARLVDGADAPRHARDDRRQQCRHRGRDGRGGERVELVPGHPATASQAHPP